MSTALVLKEADIARTCSDLLQADGWRMLITDPVSNRALGKGFGEIGMADRLFIRYAIMPIEVPISARILADVLWIEFKRVVRGRASKPTPAQLAWHSAERARGALTLIAGIDFEASIEGFMAWYRASGLARKVK